MADPRLAYAETLLDVANDAARAASTRFLTFLTVGVYVAITIAGTNDEMLVRGTVVTLPLVSTQIPISGSFGFYTVAPWLLVLLHFDLLLQLNALTRRLARFAQVTRDLPAEDHTRLHARVLNLYAIESTAGMESGALQRLSRGIIWFGVILLPLGLLLGIQVRFLPFHSREFTALHRLAIVVDVLLIVLLWPRLVVDERAAEQSDKPRWRGSRRVPLLVAALCLAVVGASFAAVIPRDRTTGPCDKSAAGSPGGGFGSLPWVADLRRAWFAARNLDLRERVLTHDALTAKTINILRDGPVAARDAAIADVSDLNFLQGRDLRYANLFHAVLPRLDLRSRQDGPVVVQTRLRGADLSWSQMQRILLDNADLEDAKLVGAALQSGVLLSTRLAGADLSSAQLQEANLDGAHLECARLVGANLNGANLNRTVLPDTDLSGASLQGASLRGAQLQHANLSGAHLEGADLRDANLEGANLRGAHLVAALMRNTALWGADFDRTDLDLLDVPSNAHAEVLQSAQIDRCTVDQAAVLPKCTKRLSGAEYLADVSTVLVDNVCCADAYACRGLGQWTIANAEGNETRERALALAAALERKSAALDGPAAATDCPGVKLLPAALRERLARLERSAPTPSPNRMAPGR